LIEVYPAKITGIYLIQYEYGRKVIKQEELLRPGTF